MRARTYDFDRREGLAFDSGALRNRAFAVDCRESFTREHLRRSCAILSDEPWRGLALVGVIATGALLIYQHTLVRADDLSRLNAAFFTTNAFVSVILFVTFGSAVFFDT